jgi:hypothetical protein
MRKVTYYLGAGASYNALPIQNELCYKMKKVGMMLLNHLPINYNTKEVESHIKDPNDSVTTLAHDLIYFADRGLQFGTIDTYARKLSIINESLLLARLKTSINAFFIIYQSLSESLHQYLQADSAKFKGQASQIDRRYYSLLSTMLDWHKTEGVNFVKNVQFITWNYDLQLELAFNAFTSLGLNEIDKHFSKLNTPKGTNQQKIIHMNGYSGFGKSKNELDICLIKLNSIDSAEQIRPFVANWGNNHRELMESLSSNIQFAWERTNTEEATNIRIKYAKEFINKTESLIIIGYSFPAFNRQIDTEILKSLSGTSPSILYCDPSATLAKITPVLDQNLIQRVKIINDIESGFIGPDDI